ncbi:MAG: DUF190 domain-containing protein [Actinobacteria bacterium]|nr:DUF190 domain-containing protein [Actinomycetota bacterium]
MHQEGRGERLTVFVDENDHYHHRPLYVEIIQRARKAGLAGATALRGIEGFGASTVLHEAHALHLSDALPVAIMIIDRSDRIEAFLPTLDELIDEGLVVREPLEVLTYGARGRQ